MAAAESTQTLAHAGAPADGMTLRPALPALVLTMTVVVGLVSSQGGYFPTSWGLIATLLLWAVGLWLVVSGRTDMGRLDLAFFVLLAAYTCWVGLSIAWSLVPGESVLELERTVLVVAGVTAVLALARREHVPSLVGLLLFAITAVSTYSLATRLFPDRLGAYDPIAEYRLSRPVGYWNALGIFTVMGLLLALGTVSDAKRKAARAAAGASTVFLATTLYFTYSRGSWLALACGLVALFAVSPSRLRSAAGALACGIPAALAVLFASHSYALTHGDVTSARSAADGHRLAPVLVAFSLLAAVLSVALALVQSRVVVPRTVRLAGGAALLAAIALGATGALAREEGPVAMTRRAWHAFETAPPHQSYEYQTRLFNLSGNGRPDLWAAALDEYSKDPVTGGGAGSFERYWQRKQNASFKVRDAHSLYVETLAELGAPGLALLLCALFVPVLAALLVRRQPILPAALAAYAAFLVHAGVDWDWELSGVALTALLIGALAVIAARGGVPRVIGRNTRVTGAACVVVASMAMIVAYLGNGALNRAENAVADKSYATAVNDANRARRLMPWSPWPLIARGDAELRAGAAADARASYRHAISIDSGEWRGWLGLALASNGRVRDTALARALALYPRSSEIRRAVAKLKNGTNG